MSMITGALLLMGITGTLLGVIIALFARFFKTFFLGKNPVGIEGHFIEFHCFVKNALF